MGLFNRTRRQEPGAGARTSPSGFAVNAGPNVDHPRSGAITWVPSGQTVQVAGQSIPGGLLYVGSRSLSGDGRIIEPALIDPALKVDWLRPDSAGASMGYWPAYNCIEPAARAGYLNWLLSGRSAPDAYIGFVFLYFYGLERRLLIDIASHSDHPDVGTIAREVRRLLSIYSDSSFQMYATSFLDFVEVALAGVAPKSPPELGRVGRRWEVPLAVRVGVGCFAGSGQPIPAAWALALLRSHPEVYLRTPAKRCPEEFDQLFVRRYQSRFGPGIRSATSQRNVEFTYHPASGGLRSGYTAHFEGVPDACDQVLSRIREVESSCTDALDAYSRYIGRNPGAAREPAAVGLLPDELITSTGGPLDGLRSWGETLAATGAATVQLEALVQRWSPQTEKLTKKDAVSLACLLGKFGIGIEPDVRFGSRPPAPGSQVVVFPLSPGAPAAPSPTYGAAATLVHLAAVVASADGSVDDDERLLLARHLESSLGLDEAECARLEARLGWLILNRPSLSGVKARLDALTAAQRAAIGLYLVDLAAADGVVTPDEITTLAKLYKLMGLEEADLFRTIHSRGTDSGPVTVRSADPSAPRFEIPGPESPPSGMQLDYDKVQARLAETATVNALLAEIFADEEDGPTIALPAPDVRGGARMVENLDSAHSAMAIRLCDQEAWERSDAEEAATNLGLPLLAGAIDRINEALIDLCGEPLVDGDDPLEINDYAAQEILA